MASNKLYFSFSHSLAIKYDDEKKKYIRKWFESILYSTNILYAFWFGFGMQNKVEVGARKIWAN